jgi:hypothetical protein
MAQRSKELPGGVQETERNLSNKISQGGFTVAFWCDAYSAAESRGDG